MNRFIIKKRPELCPICKGEGKYKGEKCHGCEGKGWIVIDESYWVKEHPCQDYLYITQPWIPNKTSGISR